MYRYRDWEYLSCCVSLRRLLNDNIVLTHIYYNTLSKIILLYYMLIL